MEKEVKLGILGCGVMGEGILTQILRKKIFKRENLLINDKDKERERKLSQRYKVLGLEIDKFLKESDFIILAIKPQDFLPFAKEISFHQEKVLISIMAGIEMNSLRKILGIKKIVRAMPNLMVKIGQGVIVWKGAGLNSKEIKIVKRIFNALGTEIRVRDESLIDKATLISGCGPGYLYFFEDLILRSFTRLGFPKKFVLKLLLKTFSGAIINQKEEKKQPKDLIKMVASGGGVTEKFLETLREKKIDNIFYQAAREAFKKNEQLKYDKRKTF